MTTRSFKLAAEIGILGLLYFASAIAGLSLDAVADFASLVWAPTGIAQAALLTRGARLWPGVALGAFFANLMQGAPAPFAAIIAAGNTGEALIAFALLTRLHDFRLDLRRVKDVVNLVVYAAALSTLVSATVGVGSLWLAGIVPASNFLYVWYVWWTGDALGALVVTPLLLTWISTYPRRRPGSEELILWTIVVAIGVAVFGGILPAFSLEGVVPYAYLVFPPLIWGALRLDPRSTATATALLSVTAVAAALMRQSERLGTTATERLLSLQTFMAIVAITVLMLSAAIAERKDRDQLIAFASHELRNSLSTLSLKLELCFRAVKNRAPYQLLDGFVASVGPSLTHLTTLVAELLDASRVISAIVVLDVQKLDLRTIVERTVDRLEPQLTKFGSSVELRLERVTGRWDPLRLDQVLTNLLTNAAKHGAGAPIAVSLSARDGTARLVVQDHGPGISAKDRERIFQPFVRLDHGSAGMGLGLAISSSIVQAHRGRIWVESDPPKGSRFIVELPRNLRT